MQFSLDGCADLCRLSHLTPTTFSRPLHLSPCFHPSFSYALAVGGVCFAVHWVSGSHRVHTIAMGKCEWCAMDVRLHNLKEALHLEWGELAQRLSISRSLLDQARKNTRKFGPKPMRRLVELEREAGITLALSSHVSDGHQGGLSELSTPLKKDKILALESAVATLTQNLTAVQKALEELKRDS